jgi:hypothetical protein
MYWTRKTCWHILFCRAFSAGTFTAKNFLFSSTNDGVWVDIHENARLLCLRILGATRHFLVFRSQHHPFSRKTEFLFYWNNPQKKSSIKLDISAISRNSLYFIVVYYWLENRRTAVFKQMILHFRCMNHQSTYEQKTSNYSLSWREEMTSFNRNSVALYKLFFVKWLYGLPLYHERLCECSILHFFYLFLLSSNRPNLTHSRSTYISM